MPIHTAQKLLCGLSHNLGHHHMRWFWESVSEYEYADSNGGMWEKGGQVERILPPQSPPAVIFLETNRSSKLRYQEAAGQLQEETFASKARLVLHFDVNKTIIMSDKAQVHLC